MRDAMLLLALPLALLVWVAPTALAQDEPAGADAADEQRAPEVKITLEEAGQSPQKMLRYRPGVGELQTMVLSISTTVGTKMGELAMPPTRLPTTVSTITTRIDEAGGRITASVRIDEAVLTSTEGLQPMILEQIQAAVEGSVGSKATLVMSDRGIGETIMFEREGEAGQLADQTFSSLEEMLSVLTIPLPEEGVGPGARWTAESTITRDPVDIRQKATYTLRSVDGGVMQLDVRVERSAEAQDIAMPGAPPGTRVRLTQLSGEGSGSATVTLERIVPTEARVTSSTVSEIDIEQSNGGAPQHFTQTIESRATVKPKKEKEEDQEDEGSEG